MPGRAALPPPSRAKPLSRSPTNRVRRAAAARGAPSGDDLVLLHLGRGRYFTLNETGAWIWNRIGDGATLGELRDSLVERFAVDADSAWSDLLDLLDQLASEGLVELDLDPAPGSQSA